ncbi:hypothetical protein [Zobellia uliginosa]
MNRWDKYGLYCNYAASNNILGFSFIISKHHHFAPPNKLFDGEIFISNKKIDYDGLNTMGIKVKWPNKHI